MGQVSDKLDNMNWKSTATLLGVFAILGVLVTGASFNVFDSGEDDRPDAPEVADFVEIDYNTYSTNFEVRSDALTSEDTVYMVSADAELPDEYGDHTEAAADVESEFDVDVIEVTADDEMAVIDAADIGEDEDFVAGQEYNVFTDYTSDYTSYDSFTIDSEIEKFAYTESKAQTESVELLETGEQGDTTEEVLTADGEVAGEDTTVDTGLQSRIDTIENEGEFTFTSEVEVDEGTFLFGAASVDSADDAVEEVDMTVRADGEVVYSESASEDFTDLGDDFVEQDMEYNPVTADSDVTVTVDVEYDSSGDLSGTNLLDVSVDELDDDDTEFYSASLVYE